MDMEVRVEGGLEGAARARGIAVVIDVLRAFTVSAYALAVGAAECLLVRSVEEALELAAGLPGAVVSAEVDGLPVPGVPISNSPSMVAGLDLRGRVLIQRTSAGTQGVHAAAASADRVLAAGLVVASATAQRLRDLDPAVVTLVAMGATEGHVEDEICAELLKAMLSGSAPDPRTFVERIRDSDRARSLVEAPLPGFPPEDLDLALAVDRFDFPQEVFRRDGLLHLRAVSPSIR